MFLLQISAIFEAEISRFKPNLMLNIEKIITMICRKRRYLSEKSSLPFMEKVVSGGKKHKERLFL